MKLSSLIALMLIQTALVLGGTFYMLTTFGDELDQQLDEEIDDVEEEVDDDLARIERNIRRQVREELDRRGLGTSP